MEIRFQQTIKQTVKFSGVGLHSGEKIRCRICPAPADTGIIFRVKQKNKTIVEIPARFRNIGILTYNTGLIKDDTQVLTIEHLLSALHGFEIDNALIDIDNMEIPVLDGSAAPFVYLLSEAGVEQLDRERRTMKLTAPVRIEHNGSFIEAEPSEKNILELDYSIDFNHPCIGKMRYSFTADPSVYSMQIAPARTFGFIKEVEMLRRQGLIKGASLSNAVVLDDHKIISGKLRFQNEFVRHKILDFWGDIVLLGHPLAARIRAHRAGHAMHAKFVESLLKTPGILEPVFETVPHRLKKLVPLSSPMHR